MQSSDRPIPDARMGIVMTLRHLSPQLPGALRVALFISIRGYVRVIG